MFLRFSLRWRIKLEAKCFVTQQQEQKSALVIVSFNATLRQEKVPSFNAREGVESSVSQPFFKKKERRHLHCGEVQGK